MNLIYSFFTGHWSLITEHFLMKPYKIKLVSLIIISAVTVSCASIPEKKQIELFDEINLSEKQIISEISLREHKIQELKLKIQKLKNYNDKFKSQIDLDNSYNIDVSSLARAFSKNKEIIDKFEIQIAKLNLEIRILNRKKDLI